MLVVAHLDRAYEKMQICIVLFQKHHCLVRSLLPMMSKTGI
jgi:hypothetical protein